MEQKTFEILLNDLYDRYNSSNKKEIDNILQKYIGQELDAVYYFLLKYNYAKHINYDPKLSDTKNIKQLIIDYSNGNRTLIGEKISFEEQIKSNIVKEAETKIQNTSEQLSGEMQKLHNQLQEVKKQIQDTVHVKKEEVKNNIEVKLNILYTESELILPNEINNFSIGTRFIVKDSSDKLIPLEVKDIFCDFISNPDNTIKEITIDKFI